MTCGKESHLTSFNANHDDSRRADNSHYFYNEQIPILNTPEVQFRHKLIDWLEDSSDHNGIVNETIILMNKKLLYFNLRN